ncbi:MAG: carboxylate--amine ligase, partial [Clostridia bacterium]|nr:carboxylate--amine ligase [Clostridia bacterium]
MNERKDFLPIILGSDENAYGTVRLFREAYGIRPLLLCTHRLIPTLDSNLFDLEAIQGFDSDEVFVRELKRVIAEQKKHYEKVLVVACSDYYAHMMAVHYDEFDGEIANRFADASLLEKLDTKDSFYAICEKYGLDYPKTYIVDVDERHNAPDKMGFSFPIVVKPENSNAVEYLHCKFEGKKKVYFFRTREEYDEVIAAMKASGYRGKLILQEFIPGGDDAMRVMNTYSDNDGRVRFQCLGQPVLEEYSPATLGNYAAIISRSDEELYRKIESFLNAIHYVGFANFDMKYDSRTGRYLLFEINGRPGRSSYFVRAAGHNMMQILTETVIDENNLVDVVRNDTVALWTAVPKGVLMKYVSSPELKREIAALWKKKPPARTLFSPEEKSLKRRLRVLRYYFGYFKSYKRYYFNKETL